MTPSASGHLAASSLSPARGPVERGRTRATALGEVLGGLCLTGVGIGVFARHLAKTGVTWTAVPGGLLLLAGLALLSAAWRVFWRTSHRWHRLWFVPAVIVALLAMFSIAQGAMFAYAPRTTLTGAAPSQLGLPYSNVTFRTADGVTLSGWFIPSSNHAAIITVPGAGSNRTATLGQAKVLAQHGYGVLMIDPRGQGRSGGHAMDAGWYGNRDLTAAVTFVRHQPGIDPTRVGVLGLSMGGEEAIGAAAAVQPAIPAVAAEGATHRTAADKAGYLPGGVAGAIQRGLDKLTYATAAILSPAPQPETLHQSIDRARSTAFLLIAGGAAVDENDAVAYLRTAAPDRVRTWTVPDAPHTRGLATDPAQWSSHVVGFFDHILRPRVTGTD